jgi:hypothetical protein
MGSRQVSVGQVDDRAAKWDGVKLKKWGGVEGIGEVRR